MTLANHVQNKLITANLPFIAILPLSIAKHMWSYTARRADMAIPL